MKNFRYLLAVFVTAFILAGMVAEAQETTDGLSVTRYPFFGRKLSFEKGELLEAPQAPAVAMAGEKWVERGVVDPAEFEAGPLVKDKDDLFWAAKFTGALVAPESGEYVFRVRADDYAVLIVGPRVLLNQYGKRAGQTTEGEPISLDAGQAYPVLIEYWNVLGPSVLELDWKTPASEEFLRVPRSAFRPQRPVSPQTVTSIRYFPAPGKAQAMVGGQFAGSLTSPTNDFVTLAQIEEAPEQGQWSTIQVQDPRPFRYVKYIGPAGSHGVVAELEFYSGDKKVEGEAFGTVVEEGAETDHSKAFDGKTDTIYRGMVADLQYVGIDLGEESQVPQPQISRLDTESDAQTFVQIDVPEGALVRYTLSPDEKWQQQDEPTLLRGTLYDQPFAIETDRTVMARAFDMSRAPSAAASKEITVRKIEMRDGLTTVHTGNSLMGGLKGFIPMIAASAGINHTMEGFGMAGAPTDLIWKSTNRGDAARKWIAEARPSVYVPQPFSRGPGKESYWETVWFNYVLEHNPDARLMIYMQWPKDSRHESEAANLIRLGDMPKTLDDKPWPIDLKDYVQDGETVREVGWRGECLVLPEAKSWREDVENYARSYDMLYKIMDKQFPNSHVSVIPVGMALARIYDAIVAGEMPGVDSETGHKFFFADGLHLNPSGQYVSALTHFACFYETDPAGKVSSAGSGLTPEQATAVQRLVWQAVQDYPHSPLNIE